MNASHNTSTIVATNRHSPGRSWRSRSITMLVGLLAAFNAASATAIDIAPSPLFLGSIVPGTLVLTPSVEWPTGDSIANINAYDVTKTYVGYFDPAKCYLYNYDVIEANRYFYPVGAASSNACATSPQWSGNYLDWVATQTIDPFRLALTGGNRVGLPSQAPGTETASVTYLQKAKQDGQGSNADRNLPTTYIVGATAAKAGWGSMQTRINGLGFQMYFTRWDSRPGGSPNIDANPPSILVAYNPADANQLKPTGKYDDDGNVATPDVYDNRVYAVSIRVQVCVPSMLESNCKPYGSYYKPEGLIQKYSDKIRYSIFGYLNDNTVNRDGAALRVKQKFVGPLTYDPIAGTAANANKEWDPTTGVLIQNPNPADVTATNTALGTSIADSGVINYLNKFGELNANNRKSYDPVSEMYYAAIRYLKNQGNIPAYTDMSAATLAQKAQFTDGFPVITTWDDPVTFRCQANAILGIGDVNTWNDKNLPTTPGQTPRTTGNEPAVPAEITADTTVNVVTATAKVAALEGITINNDAFTGRNNSAYMVGLAYDSHTVDLRPDLTNPTLPGMQTVSTYWSDVQENQVLLPKASNQYYLATKYGGFRVPAGYNPYTQTAALPQAWWHASTDVLSTGDLRPDNFYTAGDAAKMVAGLTAAFAQIVASIQGTGASFGASSTSLQSGTTLFQSSYFSNSWNGDLTAYLLDPTTGAISSTSWSAGALVTASPWASRKIYINDGTPTLAPFIWANLNGAQQGVLGASQIVDYLRGDRSNEQPTGGLRTRVGVLGDIVDSQPVYVGAPNASLYQGASFTGASTYAAFASGNSSRTPVVYVGANDGMLHGFNATTGAEVFAFVPKSAITTDLLAYATPGYAHRYSVDGELTVANVYIAGAWKTILVGTMGRGNPGVFALDVTDPANPKALWDKSAADIAALGNNLGKPIIAQVADGDWRVMLGNGPNSSAGDAQLISIRLVDGSTTTVNLGGAPNNALAAATIWDSDSDGFFDRAYAGDFQGNMWRIDGLGGVATTIKLFTATDGVKAQPITVAPLVAIRPTTTEVWLFFGTGRYLGTSDLANTDVQTWYGIIDGGATISGRSQLVQRNITDEAASGTGSVGRAIDPGLASDFVGKSGWYIDLISPVNGAQGERMVVPNIFQGLALIGVTRIPSGSDACSPGGSGFVMAIDPFTGGRLSTNFFDLNGDGVVNGSDTVGSTGKLSSGIALLTGGNGVIAVGERIYGTLDNGGQFQPPPPPSSKITSRVNWHEVNGN